MSFSGGTTVSPLLVPTEKHQNSDADLALVVRNLLEHVIKRTVLLGCRMNIAPVILSFSHTPKRTDLPRP